MHVTFRKGKKLNNKSNVGEVVKRERREKP